MTEDKILEERKKRLSEGFASVFSSKEKSELKSENRDEEKIASVEDSEKDTQPKKKEEEDIGKVTQVIPAKPEKKNIIEIRRSQILSKIINTFKKSPEAIYYFSLLIIIWVGMWIRTRNLPLIQDGALPADPDSALFLRYMQTIVEQGSLPLIDTMRYVPLGFSTIAESRFFPYVLAWMYKVISFLNPKISVIRVDLLYPIIMVPFIIIAFFFLVKKIFDWRIGIVASAFLAVTLPFLQRTMLGFSDKEPLGIFLFFLAFYFLVCGWKEKQVKTAAIYGLLAGVFSGLLGLTWGAVSFVFMIVGVSFLFILIIGNFNRKDFAVYVTYLLAMVPILFIWSSRYSVIDLLTDPVSGVVFFPFIAYIIYFVLQTKLKEKQLFKLPHNISSIILTIFIGILGVLALKGPKFLVELWPKIKLHLLHPFGVIRLTLTVSENQQPFIQTWMGTYGYLFWFMILGAVLLCWLIFSPLKKKYKYPMMGFSVLFIFSVIFTRWKAGSILNGESAISQLIFFGGMALFVLAFLFIYLKAYYTDKEGFADFAKIDKVLVFTLIWFIWLAIGARGAIRLLFLFSPIVAVLGALFLVKTAEFGYKLKDKVFKIVIIVLVVVITLMVLNSFIQSGSAMTKNSYPHLNPQWTKLMSWVQTNTLPDAVFAHWWDYGYWVQTAGKRATILDGGNAYPVWDYFMGRFVLTTQDENKALEFLYTHKATHLLIDPSDIGKYSAYSTIGSDASFDRASWIAPFNIDDSATQETREGNIYLYSGSTALDQDFTWQGELFAAGGSGIAGFFVPAVQQEDRVSFAKPIAVVVKNNQRYDIPLNCVYYREEKIEFDGEGLDGCLFIYPRLTNGGELNNIGAAFYLSPKIKNSLMARLYFFEEESPYFKLVKRENDQTVISLRAQKINIPYFLDFNGLRAPIKVWEISYPSNIESNPEYLELEFRDESVMFAQGYA